MIRVLIADDHQLMRQGLRVLLEKAQDIEIVAEARDGLEALEMDEKHSPEIILMDIQMPRLDGLRATERLRERGSKCNVLILSMFADQALVRRALQNGAKGYFIKNGSREELISAIRTVHNGDVFLSPSISDTPNP